LISLFRGARYIADYDILSIYGKGYIWGNVIIFAVGVLLLVWGIVKAYRKAHGKGAGPPFGC